MPSIRQVMRGLALGATVLLAGCADEDGASPFQPAENIAGVWVHRYEIDPLADFAWLPNDTLFLRNATGIWSRTRQVPGSPLATEQELTEVTVEGDGMRVFLNFAPCAACLTMVPPPHYRVVRTGETELYVHDLLVPGNAPQRYERVLPVWNNANVLE